MVKSVFLIALISTSLLFSATLNVPSKSHPTLSSAAATAGEGDTVLISPGTYRVNIVLNTGVLVRAKKPLAAVVDGRGRGVTVSMTNDCTIEGLIIQNGTIGVFSSSSGNTVSGCRIVKNLQSGILCVGHLPAISDNVIAFNKASGIQGWDLRSTDAALKHNTICYNDNHGIALGGNSNVVAELNIVAFNGQFGIKTGEGAIRVTLRHNNIFDNAGVSLSLPSENIASDPLFSDPYAMDFSLAPKSPCRAAGPKGEDIGARAPSLRK